MRKYIALACLIAVLIVSLPGSAHAQPPQHPHRHHHHRHHHHRRHVVHHAH